MNKRYIDFVPAKKKIPKGGVAKPKSIKVTTKIAEKPVEKPVKKPVKKITRRIPAANPLLDEDIEVEEIFAERKEPKKAPKKAPEPKFVKTEVKKRPLSTKPAAKVVAKPAAVKRPAPLGQRTKFINTNKIEKRPLSKSTAPRKPVVVPKIEPPKAPEKIISKPEKDSKAGLIIAIILTIILGAAAGTVAFLLLPK